jgi:hypothetical protein
MWVGKLALITDISVQGRLGLTPVRALPWVAWCREVVGSFIKGSGAYDAYEAEQ